MDRLRNGGHRQAPAAAERGSGGQDIMDVTHPRGRQESGATQRQVTANNLYLLGLLAVSWTY